MIDKPVLLRKIACLLKKYKDSNLNSFDIPIVKKEIINLANNI